MISVLSDGLGSGIRANVLSTMTATMALRSIEGNMSPQQTTETDLPDSAGVQHPEDQLLHPDHCRRG